MEKLKTKKIKKGRHFACGLPAFLDGMGIVRHDGVIYSKNIMFDGGCAYILDGEDAKNQLAWSKLCGFCFGIFGIHRDSFRFGWRYNPETGRIEIAMLIYNGGRVVREKLCDVEIRRLYRFRIIHSAFISEVGFCVGDDNGNIIASETRAVTVRGTRMKFGCGFYFGGRSKAPNDMEIKIVEGKLPW